jgi:MoxR-like ATPase
MSKRETLRSPAEAHGPAIDDGQPSVAPQVPRAGTGRSSLNAVPDSRSVQAAIGTAHLLLANLESVVRGKRPQLRLAVSALACGGHVLLEDVPGTAKTILARAIAGSIKGAKASRIQCTPDLQPGDITGSSIYNQRTREFEFRAGPVFANVVLVDEVNRATPKTQAALLEAMAERQVTVDGMTRELPELFLILATENPVEHEGTFLLPESQLDRFFIRTSLGYPDPDDEVEILIDQQREHPIRHLRAVVGASDVLVLQRAVEDVYLDPLLRKWIVALVGATRSLEFLELGASVRGSLALERAARALALLDGRAYADPEDVEALFGPVIGHRVVFKPGFVASIRESGREEAMRQLWAGCLRLAPRPVPHGVADTGS